MRNILLFFLKLCKNPLKTSQCGETRSVLLRRLNLDMRFLECAGLVSNFTQRVGPKEQGMRITKMDQMLKCCRPLTGKMPGDKIGPAGGD